MHFYLIYLKVIYYIIILNLVTFNYNIAMNSTLIQNDELDLLTLDTQILGLGSFIIDKIDNIETLSNREEIKILINRLFEIYSYKLVALNNKVKEMSKLDSEKDKKLTDEYSKRLDGLSIIITYLLNYKSMAKSIKSKKTN